jgi:hypothetical protein
LTLAESLQDLGYEERSDLEAADNQLDLSIVPEKDGFPRWELFVETVEQRHRAALRVTLTL